MQISKIILGWLVILTILAVNCKPAPILAQTTGSASPWLETVNKSGLDQVGTTAYGTTTPKDIREIVVQIIQVILGLLGIVFVVLMVIAGWTWMMSQGNEEKITKAKQTIFTAAIGLLIVLASFAITWYISNRIIYSVTGKAPLTTLGTTP